MGSPLKLVLVGISIVNLERSLVCLLAAEPRFWKRYVDDTITFVKTGTVDHILSMLNNFHLISNSHMRQNKKNKLAFLDVMLCRDGKDIVTTVYRKVFKADVYLNWNSFAPHSWKRGTIKALTRHAYMICSTTE